MLGKLGFAALVYFIWKERNSRIFDQVSLDVVPLMCWIDQVIRLRVMSCKPFPKMDSNRHLVLMRSLPLSVLGEQFVFCVFSYVLTLCLDQGICPFALYINFLFSVIYFIYLSKKKTHAISSCHGCVDLTIWHICNMALLTSVE